MTKPDDISEEAWNGAEEPAMVVFDASVDLYETGASAVDVRVVIARAIDAAILSAKAEQQQAERERINALIEEKAQAFTGSANPLASELVAALDDLRVCVARGERASAIRAGV